MRDGGETWVQGGRCSGDGERRGGLGTERRAIIPLRLNTRDASHGCGGDGAACGYDNTCISPHLGSTLSILRPSA